MQRSLLVAAVAAAVSCLLVTDVNAESGVQVTLDGTANLVSKDVGNERWAITYNIAEKTALGNVFRSDGGEPAFVWCENIAQGGDTAVLNCFGADRCLDAPCSASDWTSLGQVELPLGFFYPPSVTATPFPNPTTTPRPTGTPIATDPLADLLGTWNFTFTINSTFTDTYRLRQIKSVNGVRTIVGVDQFDETVIASRLQDISPGSTVPEEFGLFDGSLYLCELHVFNHSLGSDSVAGRTVVTLGDGAGGCDTSIGDVYTMSGVRTSHAIGAAAFDMPRAAKAHAIATRSEYLVAEQTLVASGIPLDPALQALFQRMLEAR
jgi:hypothetical protein